MVGTPVVGDKVGANVGALVGRLVGKRVCPGRKGGSVGRFVGFEVNKVGDFVTVTVGVFDVGLDVGAFVVIVGGVGALLDGLDVLAAGKQIAGMLPGTHTPQFCPPVYRS